MKKRPILCNRCKDPVYDAWTVLAAMPTWIERLNNYAALRNRFLRKLAYQRGIIQKLRAAIGRDDVFTQPKDTLKGRIYWLDREVSEAKQLLHSTKQQLEDEKKVVTQLLGDLHKSEQQVRIANNVISTLGTGSIRTRLRWILKGDRKS